MQKERTKAKKRPKTARKKKKKKILFFCSSKLAEMGKNKLKTCQ